MTGNTRFWQVEELTVHVKSLLTTEAWHRLQELGRGVEQQGYVLITPPLKVKLKENVFGSRVCSWKDPDIIDAGRHIAKLKPAQSSL